MPLLNILGQENAARLFQAAVANGRLGHAYLLTGPDGVGKTLFAREVAATLLCRGEGERPCGRCSDCAMVLHERHPDLSLVQAAEGKRFITIDQAREVSQYLSLRPVQSERRVVILREADRMNEEAGNCLLKTLEEPSRFGLLLLTTDRPQSMLDTIRSRCQEIRFAPLSPEHLKDILGRDSGMEPHAVELAARLSGGSAGRARQMIESGALVEFAETLPHVLALPNTDLFMLADGIQEWAKEAGSKLEPQRERLRELLRLHGLAFRDMLLIAVGAGEMIDFAGGEAGQLHAVAARLAPGTVVRMIDALQEARRQIDANAAAGLVLDNLFVRLGALQQGAGT